jgi:hypothetical protein
MTGRISVETVIAGISSRQIEPVESSVVPSNNRENTNIVLTIATWHAIQ